MMMRKNNNNNNIFYSKQLFFSRFNLKRRTYLNSLYRHSLDFGPVYEVYYMSVCIVSCIKMFLWTHGKGILKTIGFTNECSYTLNFGMKRVMQMFHPFVPHHL